MQSPVSFFLWHRIQGFSFVFIYSFIRWSGFIQFISTDRPLKTAEGSLTLVWRRSGEQRCHPMSVFLSALLFATAKKTMPPSALAPASPYLGPRSNYAQSQGLKRKQPGLVCASAVIKRGAKKGINDLIEEERKGGNHTGSGSGGESMNGAPGTLLEQGIVGLLKCVKILVVLQSRWWLVVRIPSILLFVNPERLLLFLPVASPQKFMQHTTKLKHWSTLLQINSLNISLSLSLFFLKFWPNQKGCCV